jgi:lipoprotein NlpD
MTRYALPAVLAAALAAAGCSMRQAPAPVVDDRRPTPAAKPKPPVAQQTPVPGAPAARSPQYVVKRGDTLYSIALEHGVDYRDLQVWNKLDDPSRIRVGQVLRVAPPEEASGVQVGAARGAGTLDARPLGKEPAAAPAIADGAAKTAPKALRLPYSEQNLAMLSKGEPAPAAAKPQPVAAAPSAAPSSPGAAPPAPSPSPAASAPPAPQASAAPAGRAFDPDAIEFIWPAKGKVLAGFSEATNKGVDISGSAGDPVVAAAPGRVMYTGTGIRGYGKLIVIKHDNGFNSVYAHNREILVKEGQNVMRGQRIAELGDTDASAPKLHFEIRKSGKPVDPLRYLPPS